MFKRIFKWGTDDNGSDGWLMLDMPYFDASSGDGIAHDTLEHFDNDVSAEGEYQAFGSILWGRVNGGYHAILGTGPVLTNPEAKAEYLVHDLLDVLAGNDCKVVPYKRATRPIRNDDCYDTEETLAILRAKLAQYIAEDSDLRFTDASEEDKAEAPGFIIDWIRTGYRRAARRWNRINPETLASMYYDIREEGTELTRHCRLDRGEYIEGDELHVSVCPRTTRHHMRVKAYRDPFGY